MLRDSEQSGGEHGCDGNRLMKEAAPAERSDEIRAGHPLADLQGERLLGGGDGGKRHEDEEDRLRCLDTGTEAQNEEPSECEACQRCDERSCGLANTCLALGGETREGLHSARDLGQPPRAEEHVVGHPEGPVAGEGPDQHV